MCFNQGYLKPNDALLILIRPLGILCMVIWANIQHPQSSKCIISCLIKVLDGPFTPPKLFSVQKTGLHIHPRDPITFWEWSWNSNVMLRRWLNIPIMIWDYDWMPRVIWYILYVCSHVLWGELRCNCDSKNMSVNADPHSSEFPHNW